MPGDSPGTWLGKAVCRAQMISGINIIRNAGVSGGCAPPLWVFHLPLGRNANDIARPAAAASAIAISADNFGYWACAGGI